MFIASFCAGSQGLSPIGATEFPKAKLVAPDPDSAVRHERRAVRSLQRRQLGRIMHRPAAVVVEREVQPLPIFANKTIGIVHPAAWPVAAFRLDDPLIRPCLHAVEADPQRHRAPMLAIGVVQDRHGVAAERIKRGFAAWVRDRRDAGELGPGFTSILAFGFVEQAAEAIGADDHGDPALGMFEEIVFGQPK